VLLLVAPTSIPAQQQAPPSQPRSQVELQSKTILTESGLDFPPEAIAAAELGLDFKAIKDRPFQGEMVVETERKLADGNTFSRKSTSVFYRDSKGRLREEKTIKSPANQEVQLPMRSMITISDLENHVHYALFPEMKGGFRTQMPAALTAQADSSRVTPWSPQRNQKYTREVLGYQMIEGLQCEGVLERVTIPVGAVGNPFPLESVTERWYSAELQINLLIKHSDPRTGEITIRMTNVVREEPPESLFEIPSGYQIQEGQTTTITRVPQDKP
jgi:hypothetical protein